MILIFLAILFSASLVISFKLFVKLKVNTFHAILVNYFVAAFTSYLFAEKNFEINPSDNWFKFASGMGLLFILTFVATSITAQKISVITSMIASKMSLIIPLTYAVIFVGEQMTLLKFTAIVLAMIGVVLTVIQPKNNELKSRNMKSILLIAAVFAGSGLVDTSFKYIENNFYATGVPPQWVMMVCYASAAVLGTLYWILQSLRIKPHISYRSVIAGILLGVLNYFSFIFVVESLHNPLLPSTVVFPLINVGVLLLATFIAIILFHERLRTINYIGVILSILSILVLAMQNYVI